MEREERDWAIPAFLIVSLVITILVYAVRMRARYAIAKNAGLDDTLISLATLPLVGLTISTILGVRIYGYQWHSKDQTQQSFLTLGQITLAIVINYMVATTITKISILCFYRRITGAVAPTMVYWIWGNIIFCVAYSFTFLFGFIFICTPVSGFFHRYDVSWKAQNTMSCRNEGALFVACAAISSAQDLVICVLPVFLVWDLRMSKKQKIGLCGIFGMGLMTSVCGILRTYYAAHTYYISDDKSWDGYWGWIWTTLEAQLGVICASAPAMKIFFKHYYSTKHTSRTGTSGTFHRAKTRFLSSIQPRPSVQQSHRNADGRSQEDIPLEGTHAGDGLGVGRSER